MNFFLIGAGFGELLPLVGAVQIAPQTSHLCRDLKSTILLCYDLKNMKFRQEVTVCQCEVVSIEKTSCGLWDVAGFVRVDLVR